MYWGASLQILHCIRFAATIALEPKKKAELIHLLTTLAATAASFITLQRIFQARPDTPPECGSSQ